MNGFRYCLGHDSHFKPEIRGTLQRAVWK